MPKPETENITNESQIKVFQKYVIAPIRFRFFPTDYFQKSTAIMVNLARAQVDLQIKLLKSTVNYVCSAEFKSNKTVNQF